MPTMPTTGRSHSQRGTPVQRQDTGRIKHGSTAGFETIRTTIVAVLSVQIKDRWEYWSEGDMMVECLHVADGLLDGRSAAGSGAQHGLRASRGAIVARCCDHQKGPNRSRIIGAFQAFAITEVDTSPPQREGIAQLSARCGTDAARDSFAVTACRTILGCAVVAPEH